MLRSALGSALRAARAQAPRCAADPAPSNWPWVPDQRSSVNDASHRRERAAPRPGRVAFRAPKASFRAQVITLLSGRR